MGGNPNFGLMRLVFSAIFHMQKKLSEHEEHGEEGPEGEGEEGEKESQQEPAGETTLEVPNGRVTLPPITPAKSFTQANGVLKDSTHAQKPPTSPASPLPDTGKAPPDTGKERELITLVLSGFENHNRVSYLTKAYQRFVPNDFLSYLGKEKVEHVDIGDSMMTNITTMFIEIHGFQPKTKIVSEKTLNQLQSMKRFTDPPPSPAPSSPSLKPSLASSRNQSLQPSPSSNTLSATASNRKLGRVASRNTVSMRADLFSFQFLNTISQKLLPIIRQCDGYVDKFFGNAILALFPNLDSATSAGLQIMAAVKAFDNPDDSEDHHAPYAQIGYAYIHFLISHMQVAYIFRSFYSLMFFIA
jgi:hypothetical protein